MLERDSAKRRKLNTPSVGRILSINSHANDVLLLSAMLSIPMVRSFIDTHNGMNLAQSIIFALPTFAFGTGGLIMKRNSLRAYNTTMAVLKLGEKNSSNAKIRAMTYVTRGIVGYCAYLGVEQAFKDFYGDTWKKEFDLIPFPEHVLDIVRKQRKKSNSTETPQT